MYISQKIKIFPNNILIYISQNMLSIRTFVITLTIDWWTMFSSSEKNILTFYNGENGWIYVLLMQYKFYSR